ncbi:MAG TPA: GNAT family N-acetyltransferase [Candidatus Binataceae bacterium]|nr:GNAT family N-acetyltransferase [Candidatus Binataceae bacterium]
METQPGVYLFYRADAAASRAKALASGYSAGFWRPSITCAAPVGLPMSERSRFRLRWLFHYARIFSNRDYRVFVVRQGAEMAHYSGVTGRYWRFPFMAKDDLQIGDTWTHPDHRGKGLAGFAASQILAAMSHRGRHIWYVVESINMPSIRTAEGAGMSLYGRGVWRRPLNLKPLGSFVVRETLAAGGAVSAQDGGASSGAANSRATEQISNPAPSAIRRT